MKKITFTLLLTLFSLISAEDILSFASAPIKPGPARQGDTLLFEFDLTVKEGWHIWGNKLNDRDLVPTKFEVRDPVNVEVLDIRYPQAVPRTLLGLTESVFEGQQKVTVRLRVSGSGASSFNAALRYQGCNDKLCLPPAEKKTAVSFQSAGGGEGVGDRLGRYGILAALFFLFLAGLGLNLTPCVYPVIPITLSFFAGQADKSRGKTIALAGLYVLGIALTYSALGTFAALSGRIMGTLLQNPVVLWGIVGVFTLLALSMFGLYEIRPPSFLMQYGVGHKGYFGALFMGLIVGVVIAPCVGPVTAALLIYVAERKDPLIGFLYFFVLALGLGLPYFLLGFFSGSFKNLPGSGGWLVWVKKFFGFVLIGMAVYYTKPLLPARAVEWLFWLLLVASAVYLGFMEKSAGARFPKFIIFQRLFAALLLIVSFLLFSDTLLMRQAEGGKSGHATDFSEAVYEAASRDSVPFVVDFRAEWCVPCREFEEAVLGDSAVKTVLTGVRVYTVDLTNEEDKAAKDLLRIFRVVGVPTVLFFSPGGAEAQRETRLMEKWAFVEAVQKIKANKRREGQ